MRYRTVIALVLAIILAVAVFYYRGQQYTTQPTGGPDVAAVDEGPGDDGTVTGTKRDQPATIDPQISEQPRLDGSSAVRIARAAAMFEQAEAGSPAAQYGVARLLDTCNELLDDSFIYRIKYLEQQGKPPWYLEKLQADADACLEVPFQNLETMEPAYWLEQAKISGSPAALAEFLGLVEDVSDLSGTDALAAKVLLAKNGQAYYKLIPYLVHRDKQMGVYDVKFDTARNGAMISLACHFGFRECEPGSRMVYELCVNAVPMCVPDMGMMEYLERFEWTSEQAQLYEVLFQQYLQAIEGGDVAVIFADN